MEGVLKRKCSNLKSPAPKKRKQSFLHVAVKDLADVTDSQMPHISNFISARLCELKTPVTVKGSITPVGILKPASTGLARAVYPDMNNGSKKVHFNIPNASGSASSSRDDELTTFNGDTLISPVEYQGNPFEHMENMHFTQCFSTKCEDGNTFSSETDSVIFSGKQIQDTHMFRFFRQTSPTELEELKRSHLCKSLTGITYHEEIHVGHIENFQGILQNLQETIRLLDKFELRQLSAMVDVRVRRNSVSKNKRNSRVVKEENKEYNQQKDHGPIQTLHVASNEPPMPFFSPTSNFGAVYAPKWEEKRRVDNNINFDPMQLPYLSPMPLAATDPVLYTSPSAKSLRYHPTRIGLDNISREFAEAKVMENVKDVWELSDLKLLGAYLYFQMKWRLEKIALGMESTWDGHSMAHTSIMLPSKQNLIHLLRAKALTQCKKLARRCGSLRALLGRSDSCKAFYHLCSTSFLFKEEEIMKMERQSYVPELQLFSPAPSW